MATKIRRKGSFGLSLPHSHDGNPYNYGACFTQAYSVPSDEKHKHSDSCYRTTEAPDYKYVCYWSNGQPVAHDWEKISDSDSRYRCRECGTIEPDMYQPETSGTQMVKELACGKVEGVDPAYYYDMYNQTCNDAYNGYITVSSAENGRYKLSIGASFSKPNSGISSITWYDPSGKVIGTGYSTYGINRNGIYKAVVNWSDIGAGKSMTIEVEVVDAINILNGEVRIVRVYYGSKDINEVKGKVLNKE